MTLNRRTTPSPSSQTTTRPPIPHLSTVPTGADSDRAPSAGGPARQIYHRRRLRIARVSGWKISVLQEVGGERNLAPAYVRRFCQEGIARRSRWRIDRKSVV